MMTLLPVIIHFQVSATDGFSRKLQRNFSLYIFNFIFPLEIQRIFLIFYIFKTFSKISNNKKSRIIKIVRDFYIFP